MHGLLAFTLDRKNIPLARRMNISAALDQLRAQCVDQPIDNLVVLSTCERFEMYASPGEALVECVHNNAWMSGLVTDGNWLTNDDAVRHVFRVASGLESRLAGEPHVLGQVRDAYTSAQQHSRASGDFARLFEAALRCGRRVRRQTALGQVNATYAHLAADYLFDRLGLLRHRALGIVGTGSLARETASALRDRGADHITLFGRHPERTRKAAHLVGASWASLDELKSTAPALDAIVCAAGSSQPIVDHHHLQECENIIVVDLGMPPNADVELIQHHQGVDVRRLDDFCVTDDLDAAIAEAEAMVEYAMTRFMQRSPIATRPKPDPTTFVGALV